MSAMRIRSVILVLICVMVASALCAQAMSMVLTKREPSLALAIFPWNGEAKERKAFRVFRDAVGDGALQVNEAAQAARSIATSAIKANPLSPDAHAILARATRDADTKRRIVDLAYRMNRRDLNLQAIVLEQAVGEQDIQGTTQALDQILRAHPAYSTEFFEPLLEAFKQPGAGPVFLELFDESAPWHEQFLLYALREQSVHLLLADLRPSLDDVPEGFDKRLIFGLAQQGAVADAFQMYRDLPGGSARSTGAQAIWQTRYPPIDWNLQSSPGFRAFASSDRSLLSLNVEPGKGGVIASRLLTLSELPQTFATRVSAISGNISRNLRIELRCAGEGETFAQIAMQTGENQFTIPARKDVACDIIYLDFNARVFRGEETLEVELSALLPAN